MKKLVIASGLCMAVSGCIGFSWTSPNTDIGTCVRLIALSGISRALRPKNMIKSTF